MNIRGRYESQAAESGDSRQPSTDLRGGCIDQHDASEAFPMAARMRSVTAVTRSPPPMKVPVPTADRSDTTFDDKSKFRARRTNTGRAAGYKRYCEALSLRASGWSKDLAIAVIKRLTWIRRLTALGAMLDARYLAWPSLDEPNCRRIVTCYTQGRSVKKSDCPIFRA